MALDRNDLELMAYKNATTPAEKRKWSGVLLKKNMALVVKMVKKYSRYAPASVEHEDLIQAGCIAFLQTLDRVDPDRKFSTLYAYWVRSEIGKCIDRSTTIYRPKSANIPYPIWQKMQSIETRRGRPATAEELGVTQARLDRWLTLPTTQSLDQEIVDGGTLHEAVPNPDEITAEQALVQEDRHAELVDAIEILPKEHRAVIMALFIGEKEPKQVAKEYQISVDTVLALQEQALGYLRDHLE